MINSVNDINWVKKSRKGVQTNNTYDVRFNLVKRGLKSERKALHFIFSNTGIEKLGSKYFLYAYDNEGNRIFFKPENRDAGYSLGENEPYAALCAVPQELVDALSKYQGWYRFERIEDGTLFIQLEGMK